MSSRTCPVCRHSFPAKLATFYWRWRYPSELSVGFRQQRCRSCSAAVAERISYQLDHWDHCIVCRGELSSREWQYVNCTMYIPGVEKDSFTLLSHLDCLLNDNAFYSRGAVRLPDRDFSTTAPPPGAEGDHWLGWAEIDPQRG